MRKLLLFLLIGITLSGCVVNDIPYPVIAGDVVKVKFAGERTNKIDQAKRTITVTLNDTVDIRAVEVLSLEITPDSRCDIALGQKLDFSQASGKYAVSEKPYAFNVYTYQTYGWTIICTQEVVYKFEVQGGVKTNIDAENKTVQVDVGKGEPLSAIVVDDYCFAPAGAVYTPDPRTLTDYRNPLKVEVKFFDVVENWTVVVQQTDVNVVTGDAKPWAMFANVTGNANSTSTLEATFEYRKKADTDWLSVAAKREGGKINGVLTGLSPNTSYMYRARLGEEIAAEKEFKTEAAFVVENMNLDLWSSTSVGSVVTWYPNELAPNTFWATGNIGVTSVSKSSNTSPTTLDAKAGKAAEIKTVRVPVVGLAAGSIYTGDFILAIMAPLTSTQFSRPYKGRPTQFKFWYKYAPVRIDVAGGKPDELGKMDRCNIYIYLGNWEGPLLSDQLLKEKTAGVVAYGEFSTDKNVSTYTQQTIQIKYYDTTKPVTQIIIVASSSIYGDLYTGGVGSTLHFDELEFGWEPQP